MSAPRQPSAVSPDGPARDAAALRVEYQGVLDPMAAALQDEDVDACAAHFALPVRVSNMDGTLRADSCEDLHGLLADHIAACRRHGIVRIAMTCEAARIDRSGCLEGCHLTRVSRQNTSQTEAAHSRLVMKQDAGRWKILRLETGLDRDIWQMRPDRYMPVEGRTLSDAQFMAHTILQGVLNVTTLHVMNGDAEGFAGNAVFPIFVQSRKGRYTIDGIDALREDMALYREEFRIHSVDDVYRPIKSAEFVGTDKISGTCTTYILSRGRLVVDPYESAVTLQRGPEGRWRITSIMHGLGHLDWKPPGAGS